MGWERRIRQSRWANAVLCVRVEMTGSAAAPHLGQPTGAGAASLPAQNATTARGRGAIAALEDAGAATCDEHGGVVIAAEGVAAHVALNHVNLDAERPAHGGVRGSTNKPRRARAGRAVSSVEQLPMDGDWRARVHHCVCVPNCFAVRAGATARGVS